MKEKTSGSIWLEAGILFIIALLIKIVSWFSGWIEIYYSSGIYPKISALLRVITGWIPFSVGDILYVAAIIWLIIKFIQLIKIIFRKNFTADSFLKGSGRCITVILRIYIVFNLFWGLNYDRLGISYQLKLQQDNYNISDLKLLTGNLINKVNSSRKLLGDKDVNYPSYSKIFAQAAQAYDLAKKKYPFLHYQNKSVKSSLYGVAGNYLGFLGYYNPFTGESQVNITVPPFVIPYTTCHEIAHQLGYGSESEANFTGYLAAKSSEENTFRYSVYFDLFTYANSELFMQDSIAAKENFKLLDTLVVQDMIAYRNFLAAHKNPVEPIIRMFYGEYLKANNQPKGLQTYDEVVGWLIAYQKKYGEL